MTLADRDGETGKPGLDFSVCFSGGVDSTTAAYLLGKKFTGIIHLLTMVHGCGHILQGFTSRRVKELEAILGAERIVHRFLQGKPYFRRLHLETLFRDVGKYRSDFVWCAGCLMAMDALVIIHNLEHRVPATFFCCTPTGMHFAVIALPVTTGLRQQFYREYGQVLRTPIIEWNMTKPQERAVMRRAGLWPGIVFRKLSIGRQLICLPGWKHILDFLFDIHFRYDPARVEEFILERQPMMRELIEGYFREKGQDAGELVDALRSLRAEKGIGDDFDITPDSELV